MKGFVDLHSHWIPGVDDGARTVDEGLELVMALRSVGFDHVVATPHLRPGMFDNHAEPLRSAFAAMRDHLAPLADAPNVELAGEHFFDDVVFSRMMGGQGLPYAAGRSILVEFFNESLPLSIEGRFFDLRRKRLRPVVAHPERYDAFIKKPAKSAEQLRRAGGVLLLDICALVGKYGSRAQKTAEALLEEGAYYAACSDAHRPSDAHETAAAIARLGQLFGDDEVDRLLRRGPRDIISGRILDEYD